jgi:hypothetical protein
MIQPKQQQQQQQRSGTTTTSIVNKYKKPIDPTMGSILLFINNRFYLILNYFSYMVLSNRWPHCPTKTVVPNYIKRARCD